MEYSIKKQVTDLANRVGTYDPAELCRRIGIVTAKCELPDNTRGFCITLKSGSAIMVNRNLNANQEKTCIAHELGHLVLHRNMNYMFLSQNTLMVTGKYEREANIFAAHLLLGQVTDREGYTVQQLSKKLNLPEYAVEEAVKG